MGYDFVVMDLKNVSNPKGQQNVKMCHPKTGRK